MGLAGTLDHVWPVLKTISFGIHSQNNASWNNKSSSNIDIGSKSYLQKFIFRMDFEMKFGIKNLQRISKSKTFSETSKILLVFVYKQNTNVKHFVHVI